MSSEDKELCNNPFAALFGSVSQLESYKTAVEDSATKPCMCTKRFSLKSCIVHRQPAIN